MATKKIAEEQGKRLYGQWQHIEKPLTWQRQHGDEVEGAWTDEEDDPNLRKFLVVQANRYYNPLGLWVLPSRHGYGLFTTRQFLKGQDICEYRGQFVHDNTIEELPPNYDKIAALDGYNGGLNGSVVQWDDPNIAGYANAPDRDQTINAQLETQGTKVMLWAVKNITPNASNNYLVEILIDYGEAYWHGAGTKHDPIVL